MKSESELTWTQTQNLVDALVFQVTKKHLGNAEVQVLRGAWDGKTYDAIASESHLTVKYISEVGGQLWNNLSEALEEEVKKTNFRQALQREWEKQGNKSENTVINPEIQLSAMEFDSEPYIERPPIESRCYEEICKPGALLRIQAPLQFGKTELMSRIMHHAAQQGYRTVVLNLRDAEVEDFNSLDKFLHWFITIIAETLELGQSVEEHWRKSLGNCKIKCRTYFEKYLLPGDSAVAIALDKVDKLFAYGEIAGEFLGMLRTWHEDAKTKPLWRQLRLLMLHTQVYTQLNINQSPFNAGTEIKLTDFTNEQVQSLAQQYKLNWKNTQVEQLMAMVGGHPYLVTKALQVVSGQEMTLESLLQSAPTASGIFRNHLERHWRYLQANLPVLTAFKTIVLADSPVEFNSNFNLDDAVKLDDLGLVELQNNSAVSRYQIYRLYFRERLAS
ncbi:AAA-like domain-containing protein [Tolypothrix sp. VBCCA 56010]|uniref:AAA-like domain-containing protein n=1 Tax=Tolypothrix sp. VBCCA 56010 TaxID=3137731 RepID=UPI003D7D8A79